MCIRISRILVVLLGVAGTLLGGALAQEGVEESLLDADEFNLTSTLNCEAYEEKFGSCGVEVLCNCDKLCQMLSDCCRSDFLDHVTANDYMPLPSATGNESSLTSSDVFYNITAYQVCVELPSSLTNFKFQVFTLINDGEYDLPQGFIMVAKCQPSWKDADVKELCEAPDDKSDLLLLLPVVSSYDSMTSFRNIYCAICHGVPLATVTSWGIHSKVYIDPSLRKANDSDAMVKTLNSSRYFDESNIQFKYHTLRRRRCVPNLIDNCPSGYEDDRVITACRSYIMPVVHPVTKVAYRNWYCAFCNDAIHPTICQMERLKLVPFEFGGTSSLMALVDFNGNKLSFQSFGSSLENTCGKDEFLDPFTLRCRALLCPQGSERVNGVCLKRNPPADDAGITKSECIHPGYVDMEIDTCLDGNSSSDPCELWLQCLRMPYPPVVSGEWCSTQRLISEERGCLRVERIRLTLNSTVQDFEDILSNDTETVNQRCPFMPSITKVVLKRGCIPPSRDKCDVHQIRNTSDVYFTSWNKSEALYLLDINRHISLQESLYQITYTLRGDSTSNITGTVTMCRDPVAFNCSLIKINRKMLSQLLNDNEEPVTDTDYAILDSGEALVCRHLVFPPSSMALQVVTAIGLLISMLALVASFVTYVVFPSLRNLPGLCVMSLIVAVFSTQLLIVLTGDDVARSVSQTACATLAILVHYACLSSFSWTNVLVLYLARTLGPGAKPAAATQLRHSFLYFSLFGWGAPLIIVFICVIIHLVSMETIYGVSGFKGGIRACSITNTIVEVVAFVVPISVSLLANAVLFARILMGFTSRRAPSAELCSKEVRSSRKRRDAFISVKIGFLLAFTWIFGFLATAFKSIVLLYIFCIMTSLQGLYIFLAFTFTQQVRALWREKLGLRRQDSKPNKTTQKKYFKKSSSPNADKKVLCRQQSPSGHQTADAAHTGSAKDVKMV